MVGSRAGQLSTVLFRFQGRLGETGPEGDTGPPGLIVSLHVSWSLSSGVTTASCPMFRDQMDSLETLAVRGHLEYM